VHRLTDPQLHTTDIVSKHHSAMSRRTPGSRSQVRGPFRDLATGTDSEMETGVGRMLAWCLNRLGQAGVLAHFIVKVRVLFLSS
jgi:hypothetical protein